MPCRETGEAGLESCSVSAGIALGAGFGDRRRRRRYVLVVVNASVLRMSSRPKLSVGFDRTRAGPIPEQAEPQPGGGVGTHLRSK